LRKSKLTISLIRPFDPTRFQTSHRQKADLEKEKRESQSAASAASLKSQQLEKSVLEFLEKAQIQPGKFRCIG